MDRGTAARKNSSRHDPRAVRPAARLFGLAMLSLALCGGPPARAQDGGSPAVIVNQDILNNLEWAAAAAARARTQAGTSAALLPPPATAPQSRVLVKPLRQASAPPPIPAAKPERAARPEPTPGPRAAAAPDVPDAEEADTRPRFAIAAAPAAADSLPAVPPPPEPPAPEATSLATVPPPPEPPAAPAVEPSVEPPPAPAAAAATQTAMVAPPKLSPGAFRLLFETGATALSEAARGKLAALAEQLRAAPERRIQVQAFAGGEASARDARRLSLSRATAVRRFLIELGLPAKRIDVRALGSNAGGGPADRVDILDARG